MSVRKEKNGLILIVDDNPKNIQLIGTLLDKKNFMVSIADSGEKALKIVAIDPPDLILLDIMMPGMNGFDTCHQLKADPETRDIPVIFLSALTDRVNRIEGFKTGAVDYLTKPVEPEELMIRIDTHLTIKNLRKKLQDSDSQLEEKINIRTEMLHQKNSALQERENRYRTLTGDLVHDVNRALQGITESISTIEQMTVKHEKISQEILGRHIETVRQGADQAADMINRLSFIHSGGSAKKDTEGDE